MHVLALRPTNESLRINVSFEPRNGICCSSRPIARMHSFNANNDLLISAPSSRVCRSELIVSAPRSLPAKSIRENLPYNSEHLSRLRRIIWKTACDRDEFELADVWPAVR